MIVRYARESWERVGREFTALGAAHFAETDDGVEPKRRYALDGKMMAAMCKCDALRIWSARIPGSGELIGYITWTVTPDVESAGLLIAMQGAWFVRPGNPRVGFGLFTHSLAELKMAGVKLAFPHHRLQGRGAGLGRFFRRLGGKQIQHTYSLWIGD